MTDQHTPGSLEVSCSICSPIPAYRYPGEAHPYLEGFACCRCAGHVEGTCIADAAPELLAALKDVAEQIAAYDYLHGANSCAIDDAPALAAIRDINPCYDPTVNITGTGMAQYISVYAATCQNRTERGIGH